MKNWMIEALSGNARVESSSVMRISIASTPRK
jgi:hypothetical protein